MLLRKAVKNKDWPVHEHNEEKCNTDLENDPGRKRKRDFKDEGMEIFWECMNNMEKTEKPNKGLLMLMENLSTSTSTIGMMQEYTQNFSTNWNYSCAVINATIFSLDLEE